MIPDCHASDEEAVLLGIDGSLRNHHSEVVIPDCHAPDEEAVLVGIDGLRNHHSAHTINFSV